MTTPNPQGYPGQDPNAPGQPGVPPQPGPPPGYGPPPGAPPPGYPPQGGYPPPQGGYPPPQQGGYGYPAPPPPGYPSADDKTWALVAHFGGAAGSFISLGGLAFVGPLISYLGRGSQSETVKTHAKAALNFFAPLSAAAIVLWIVRICLGFLPLGVELFLGLLLWLLQVGLAIVGIAFGVIAGMRANEGQLYKYPLNFNFIK